MAWYGCLYIFFGLYKGSMDHVVTLTRYIIAYALSPFVCVFFCTICIRARQIMKFLDNNITVERFSTKLELEHDKITV